MATARIRARAKSNPAFRSLSRQLKEAGRGDLRKELRAAIQREGAPVVAALRAATMGVDVKVDYVTGVRDDILAGRSRPDRLPESTGLRARTAAAISTQVLASGIRFRVNGRRIDPQYGDSLARYLIAGKKRWRHPIMGNRNVWVGQSGQDVWFDTMRPHLRRFRRAVQSVMDDTAKKIGG